MVRHENRHIAVVHHTRIRGRHGHQAGETSIAHTHTADSPRETTPHGSADEISQSSRRHDGHQHRTTDSRPFLSASGVFPLDNVADASQTTAAANTQTAPKRQSAPDESAESNNAEPESVPAKTKRAKKARQAATSHDVQEARKARSNGPRGIQSPGSGGGSRRRSSTIRWDRRPKFSYGFYTVVFLQWSSLPPCFYGGVCTLT